MPPTRASAATVVSRGLAARCPACGLGRVFLRRVQTAAACAFCGWRLERCPGHWIGGNEINLLATFTVGVVAFAPAALAFGLGPPAVAIAVAVSAAFSVAFYRSSRGLFFALDYLIDSTPEPLPRSRDDGAGDRGRGGDDDSDDHDGPGRGVGPRGRGLVDPRLHVVSPHSSGPRLEPVSALVAGSPSS